MLHLTFAKCLVSTLLYCSLLILVLSAAPNSTSRFPPSRKISMSFSESEISAARTKLLNDQKKPAVRQPVPILPGKGPVHPNVTDSALKTATNLISSALESVTAYNSFRIANPRRNTYESKHEGVAKTKRDEVAYLVLSDEVRSSAAFLAEVYAGNKYRNGTLYKSYPRGSAGTSSSSEKRQTGSGFWMEGVDETMGTQPYGDDSSYKVWRNVLTYGAYGDGLHDDTAAINAAIADGARCGSGCESSSVKGAIVYFPTGIYLVSTPIIALYNTQLPLDVPVIMAAEHFMGLGVITSDVYIEGASGAEWYIEQSNFYRQIRNFNIDLLGCTTVNASAIHWQVAQATSLQNIGIYMDSNSTTTQYGLYTENGSGGWMSDLWFYGGLYGIYGGNQQYSVRSLVFQGCKTAIRLIWDWGWTWKEIFIEDAHIGISLFNEAETSIAGSIYVVDSVFQNVDIAIYSTPTTNIPKGTSDITMDNVALSNVGDVILFTNGQGPNINPNSNIDFFTLGETEFDGDHFGAFGITQNRSSALTVAGSSSYPEQLWFSRSKPQYQTYGSQTFVNMKSQAKGDGVTDDTAAINLMLQLCAQWNTESEITYVLWFPAGSYVVTSTIFVPVNSYIVGQVWSQIVASGAEFENMENPTVLVQVGSPGDVGSVEISDMLFTSTGPLAGLVAMEWNVKAYKQGAATMWDSHFRIGGALGSQLQLGNCPTLSGTMNPKCIASSMLLHVTNSSSGYFENVWAWVADHDIDDPSNTQIDIYGARGILIESQGPSWFYGTASEHSVLYQYSIYQAIDVYMGMIQTESPYFQGAAGTQAPAPFSNSLGRFNGDPEWIECGMSTTSCNNAWGLEVQNSNNVFINGAAFYSWYQNYNQACLTTQDCQEKIIDIWNSGTFWLYNLITVGVVEIFTPPRNSGKFIAYAANYTSSTVKPWWCTISAYLEFTNPVDITKVAFPVRIGWTAVGDSYSAGIGAGAKYDAEDPLNCRRGQGSYPNWLQKLFIGFNDGAIPNFQFVSCSGAVSQDIIDGTQIGNTWNPQSSVDIMTLSILGNDVDFAGLAKACIFAVPGSGSCDNQITKSTDILNGGELQLNWEIILDRIISKANILNPNLVVYVTGYARFFDDTTGDPCNHNTLRLLPWSDAPLTQTLRMTLNNLADALNNKIQEYVDEYNAFRGRRVALFVNWDPQRPVPSAIFNGHRICEPGVSEPTSGSAQDNVWFFYLGGSDNVAPGPPATPPQIINSNTCSDTDPTEEAGGQAICDFAKFGVGNATFQASMNEIIASNGWDNTTAAVLSDGSVEITTAPEYYSHAFHPKSQGYNLIAVQVLSALLYR